MKNIFFLMAIACVLLLALTCNNAANIDQVLQDENNRQQIFNKIANDHELMSDFMVIMNKNNHAMMMMKGNKEMKEQMMGEKDMIQMMKSKPEVMHSMMIEMLKDGKMMGHMMKMMKDENMMSEECLDSCMKMMEGKGGESDEGKSDDHDSHNH